MEEQLCATHGAQCTMLWMSSQLSKDRGKAITIWPETSYGEGIGQVLRKHERVTTQPESSETVSKRNWHLNWVQKAEDFSNLRRKKSFPRKVYKSIKAWINREGYKVAYWGESTESLSVGVGSTKGRKVGQGQLGKGKGAMPEA